MTGERKAVPARRLIDWRPFDPCSPASGLHPHDVKPARFRLSVWRYRPAEQRLSCPHQNSSSPKSSVVQPSRPDQSSRRPRNGLPPHVSDHEPLKPPPSELSVTGQQVAAVVCNANDRSARGWLVERKRIDVMIVTYPRTCDRDDHDWSSIIAQPRSAALRETRLQDGTCASNRSYGRLTFGCARKAARSGGLATISAARSQKTMPSQAE